MCACVLVTRLQYVPMEDGGVYTLCFFPACASERAKDSRQKDTVGVNELLRPRWKINGWGDGRRWIISRYHSAVRKAYLSLHYDERGCVYHVLLRVCTHNNKPSVQIAWSGAVYLYGRCLPALKNTFICPWGVYSCRGAWASWTFHLNVPVFVSRQKENAATPYAWLFPSTTLSPLIAGHNKMLHCNCYFHTHRGIHYSCSSSRRAAQKT